MDFNSPPAGGKMDSASKEQLMSQVKQQIALANAQELLQVRFKKKLSNLNKLFNNFQGLK